MSGLRSRALRRRRSAARPAANGPTASRADASRVEEIDTPVRPAHRRATGAGPARLPLRRLQPDPARRPGAGAGWPSCWPCWPGARAAATRLLRANGYVVAAAAARARSTLLCNAVGVALMVMGLIGIVSRSPRAASATLAQLRRRPSPGRPAAAPASGRELLLRLQADARRHRHLEQVDAAAEHEEADQRRHARLDPVVLRQEARCSGRTRPARAAPAASRPPRAPRTS